MSDRQLLSYLPAILQDVKEMQIIMDMEERQFLQLQDGINRYLDDQFVMTASETALRQREAELRIQADRATESLEFRRKRIVNRYSMKAPFTERYLQARIDYLFGVGRGKVEVDIQNFILRIYASLVDASLFKEAQDTIEQIKPANLEYIAVPWVSETLSITDKVTVNLRRYHTFDEFRLGMTFMKYENEVEL